MKYTPKEDIEGINSNPDHPLKEFTILLLGSFGLIAIFVFFSGMILGELAVRNSTALEKYFSKIQIKTPDSKADELNEADPKLLSLLNNLLPETSQNKIQLSVLCDKTPNAYALPGSNIWISSALIDNVKNEKGLAFVLAHELGHIHNKDHIRAIGQSMGFTLLMGLVGIGEANSVLYKIPTQMTYLGLSRNAEENADAFAIETLKKKYTSLKGAEEFFNIILKEDKWGSKIPAILTTHPNTEKRRDNILALVEKEKPEPQIAHNITHGCKK